MTLNRDHFSLPIHQHILEAMVKLWTLEKPLDEVTILNELEATIPTASLAQVTKIILSSPTVDNIVYWAEILEEYRQRRALFALATNISNGIVGGTLQASEAHDRILEDLQGIGGDKTGDEDLAAVGDRVIETLERNWDGSSTSRLPSGIAQVDKAIQGMPVGVPTTIGARPGVGKSMTLWNICHAACVRGEHVVVLTNEDTADRTAKLGLSNHSGVERRELDNPDLAPFYKQAVREAHEKWAPINARYHMVKVHGKSMVEICRIAKALCRKYSPTIIALDYIQNVPNPEPGMNRNQGIEENLTHFDALIAEEDVVGIIIAQLKRQEQGTTPTMESFKDSGSIEQKSKLMLTLSDLSPRDGHNHYPGETNFGIGVVKNSEGLSDFTIECIVDKGLGRFQ